MQHEAAVLADKWQRQGGPQGLAVGLARGPAAVGAVGFANRQDYAAIGAVTNLAARLCAEAGAGEVWLSASVQQAVAGRFELRALPVLHLKGFAQPVQAWRCLGRHGG
jgi:class 3 adenylate cyclase